VVGRYKKKKRTLGRHRCKWADNIKIDLRKVELCGMKGINMTQGTDKWRALENNAMNVRFT
jgi:hypothetical protein